MMKKSLVTLCLVLAGLTLTLPFSGCVAVVAAGGAGGGALYIKGEHKTIFDAPVAKVKGAIPKAMKKLDLIEISAAVDYLTGEYVYRTGEDTKVTIKYRQLSASTTEVLIRVGTFGDQDLSRTIANTIGDAL